MVTDGKVQQLLHLASDQAARNRADQGDEENEYEETRPVLDLQQRSFEYDKNQQKAVGRNKDKGEGLRHKDTGDDDGTTDIHQREEVAEERL